MIPAVRFEKWQALGNDYLVVEGAGLPFPLTAERVQRLCDRHFGPGADGVLELTASEEPDAVARLRIFNPDGSEAELSGNGAREAILYLRRHGWTTEDSFTVETVAGPIRPTITGPDTCRIEIGRASLASGDFPGGPPDGRGEMEITGRPWRFQHVAVGNPQCAVRIANQAQLEALDLSVLGPRFERADDFPKRTNVSFWCALTKNRVRARIFERGVGETLASGTGACGAAIAHVLRGGVAPVTVRLDGGELEVDVSEELDVALTGWARPVYAAELDPALAAVLAAL